MLQNKPAVEVKPGNVAITSFDEMFLEKVIKVVEDNRKEPQFSI